MQNKSYSQVVWMRLPQTTVLILDTLRAETGHTRATVIRQILEAQAPKLLQEVRAAAHVVIGEEIRQELTSSQ